MQNVAANYSISINILLVVKLLIIVKVKVQTHRGLFLCILIVRKYLIHLEF